VFRISVVASMPRWLISPARSPRRAPRKILQVPRVPRSVLSTPRRTARIFIAVLLAVLMLVTEVPVTGMGLIDFFYH
jgi:hypothetical protein